MTARAVPFVLSRSEADVVDVGHLFVLHAPFLVRVVERLTGSPAQAEDIVQEAFIVAHRRRRELRDQPEVRGWLYRVCANLVRQHRRSLWRKLRLLGAVAAEPTAAAPVPDDVAARRESGRKIRACILALPFDKREAFVLFELEGESTRAVAALLGVPEGTVSSRLSSAREIFRAGWRAQEGT
ncbi:MAG TPA: sigma-70 family RNA polymerase sigma factor [Myxococcota bacterium]